MPMGRVCVICGATVTPFDEAKYYCKKCKVFECQAHGEYHIHDDENEFGNLEDDE